MSDLPWYRRALRWGQTNITEIDPVRYDVDWWRGHWRRTRVQGVIINAGGIVAYYPSEHPLHYRAAHLGERDLYGELVDAARAEDLAVLARMDSNRATADFFQAHPDWFARDQTGQPYRAGDRYVACVNSPYYTAYIPEILKEIIARTHPNGFADNSWSGLGREQLCHCEHCQAAFRRDVGAALPEVVNWDDPDYRQWVLWNYARRLEIWDQNNEVAQTYGGEDCLWLGMISGNMAHQARRFRDTRAICRRMPFILLDHQHRPDDVGFQDNAATGKLLHGLAGPDVLIPESMPMYQGRNPTFRLASKPAPEARMWMVSGFAGGIQPWWHHVSAYHEDRRQYRTAEPMMRWHETHQEYLVNRTHLASVGVLWSQRNIDFYGRDQAEERVMQPYWGTIQALIRARISYVPIHADDLEAALPSVQVLACPQVGVLSQEQLVQIRNFVQQGGSLVVSGPMGRYDEWGETRSALPLADILGVEARGERVGDIAGHDPSWEAHQKHSYLRLHPQWRARVYGPVTGDEPALEGSRHPVLEGFEEADILPFGGQIEVVEIDDAATVPLSYIPPFPIYPPETAWMREADTTIPALICHEREGESRDASRVAYLAADIDRLFARHNLSDHGDLLANLFRWAAHDRFPFRVQGQGLIDCHLYQQPGRLILHLVNLNHVGAWRSPLHALTPVGPVTVTLPLPSGVGGRRARYLVSDETRSLVPEEGAVAFEVAAIVDHEVIVVD